MTFLWRGLITFCTIKKKRKRGHGQSACQSLQYKQKLCRKMTSTNLDQLIGQASHTNSWSRPRSTWNTLPISLYVQRTRTEFRIHTGANSIFGLLNFFKINFRTKIGLLPQCEIQSVTTRHAQVSESKHCRGQVLPNEDNFKSFQDGLDADECS